MSIGDRLREERERLGYSQASFAALDSKSKRSQLDWEAGVAAPNAKYLEAIAEAGADVNYILTGRRVAYPNAPQATVLTVREERLIDNYRHASEAGQKALDQTGAALAQSKDVKKSA